MSDYESSDSELNRAIALSLQDVNKAPVIDLLSDDEDDSIDFLEASEQGKAGSNNIEAPRASPREPSSLRSVGHSSDGIGAGRVRSNDGIAQDPKDQDTSATSAAQTQYGPLGLTGADRKKMEEERLARARKRKAISISPPPLSRKSTKDRPSSTRPDTEPDRYIAMKGKANEERPPRATNSVNEEIGWQRYTTEGGVAMYPVPRPLVESKPITLLDLEDDSDMNTPSTSFKGKAHEISRLPQVLSHKQQISLLAPGIHFPKGVVKKTWVSGYPRQDDIKIEEVLQKDDLELAVLSSYQWDDEWILRKIDVRKTKVICVVQANTDEQKAQMLAGAPSKNIRFCFPSMAGQINCMHSKLQLLSYPTHLRVVVPSANLVPYDWGEEGGVMENIVFIIDLPRLPNMQRINVDEMTAFGKELIYFLKAMSMDAIVIDSILRFDFSNTSQLAFVHSIGGSHLGTKWKRTGYCGLGSAITELRLATNQPLVIDILSASVGNLNNDFLRSIYLAAQGDNGLIELSSRTSKTAKSQGLKTQSNGNISNIELPAIKEVERNFRLYYPSHETVANSKGGIGAGGTICFQSKWFDAATFPRSVMRECKSQRCGILIHSKMIFVRPYKPLRACSSQEESICVAWVYVGSANLSESAWGRLVRDKTTQQPKLNIRNWECGVIVPILQPAPACEIEHEGKSKEAEKALDKSDGPPAMEVFDGVVPVPMVVPGEEYGMKRPWFYNEH